ncbi:MAG TPA: UDP-2,3-diacylglucosamine diphosphatase LpxI [Methylomirabilota bacterium]|nr:UDP-2,3-diacylglucosamine diphosphatase LpxI [Methylomirabilota bacterium]
MGGSLGLLGGAGVLPGLMAREARALGWRVVAFALADPALLADVADRVVPCRVGELGPVLDTLREEEIHHLVLAGRVWKDGLFRGMRLDQPTRALLDQGPDWTDQGLFRTATALLTTMGIELLDQRRFLARWLAASGILAGPEPTESARADVAVGVATAQDLAARGIGQTVVVRARTVTAVEALEGTDETIGRGLRLAGPGAVVVKAAGPAHDYRLDVPAVGPDTLARCVEGRAAVLAVEAGRVLIVEPEAVEAEARRAGISVVGVPGRPGAD